MAMGQMLAQHEKHGEAITSFVKATNLKLDDVLAHFRTGNSYYAINAISEAQLSYERALEGDRNMPGEASKNLLALVSRGPNLQHATDLLKEKGLVRGHITY